MFAQCIEVEGAGGWAVGRAGGGAEGQKSQHRLRTLSSEVITHNLLKNMSTEYYRIDIVEWSVKKWGTGTDDVEWSVKTWKVGTDIVEWSVKKEGLEPILSNEWWKN